MTFAEKDDQGNPLRFQKEIWANYGFAINLN